MAFWNDPSALTPKQSHRWVISFGDHDIKESPSTEDNLLPFYFAKSVDKPSYEIGIQQAKYLYSHNFNFPKRLIWKPITITFYEAIIENYDVGFLLKPTVNSFAILDVIKFLNVSNQPTQKGLYEKVRRSTQLFFYKFLQNSGYFDPEEYDKDDALLRFRTYNFKKDMIASFVGNENDSLVDEKNKKITVNTKNWKTLNINELDSNGKITETWKIYAPLVSDIKFDKLDYSNENIVTITATIHYDWAKLVPSSNKSKQDASQNQQSISNKQQPPRIGAAARLARIEEKDKSNQESLIGSSGRSAVKLDSGFGNKEQNNVRSEIVSYSMMGRTVGQNEPLSPNVFSPSSFEGELNSTTGTTSPDDIKKLTDQLNKDLERLK